MKYQYYGKKVAYSGKTLWEIVANLKNFGVGRLIRVHEMETHKAPSFWKIVKVQALPPSKQPFEERFVQAWVEKIHKGVNVGVKPIAMTKLTKFRLVPKIEEEKYYKALEELGKDHNKKYITKYCAWPPLYKIIWEKSAKKNMSAEYKSIPKLDTVINNYPGYEIIKEEETLEPSTCSLYKYEQSVEEMYRQIVQLKKIIKANS